MLPCYFSLLRKKFAFFAAAAAIRCRYARMARIGSQLCRVCEWKKGVFPSEWEDSDFSLCVTEKRLIEFEPYLGVQNAAHITNVLARTAPYKIDIHLGQPWRTCKRF